MTRRLSTSTGRGATVFALCLALSCAAISARAEEPYVTYFKEAVAGGDEESPPLLKSPKLEVRFFRIAASGTSDADIANITATAKTVTGTVKLEGRFLELRKVPFALHAEKEVRLFEPQHLKQNQMAVIFVDVSEETGDLKQKLAEAMRLVRQTDSDARTEIIPEYPCGAYVFRTSDRTIASVLLIPPNENFKRAIHCVNRAILDTAGFRGRATTVKDCQAVRCASRPFVIFHDWDVLALSALYDAGTSQGKPALVRFEELVKALPKQP